MLTIVAFIVALGVLIAVHEYGHYRVAVACGVRVLRFSVGFGRTLWRWQPKGSPTEFVIGAFPVGGYVKMLDEREAPVRADELHLAFNRQPLAARAAIVAAGPLTSNMADSRGSANDAFHLEPLDAQRLRHACPDLHDWPRSWHVEPADMPVGQQIVQLLTPFL